MRLMGMYLTGMHLMGVYFMGLFPCHDGGSPAEMVQEVDGGRRDTVRQAKQAQPAVPIETPLWQAAAGDVAPK